MAGTGLVEKLARKLKMDQYHSARGKVGPENSYSATARKNWHAPVRRVCQCIVHMILTVNRGSVNNCVSREAPTRGGANMPRSMLIFELDFQN